MNYEIIVWVILSILGLWYSLYLIKKALYLFTNIGPLFERLERDFKTRSLKSKAEAARLQSISRAAKKIGKAGLIYLLLGLVGVLAVITMNVMLLLG